MTAFDIERMQGIEIGVSGGNRQRLLGLLSNQLKIADALTATQIDAAKGAPGGKAMTMAASASTQAVNALLTAAFAQCHLTTPPEDIEIKVNAAGNLVLRCYHTPFHEWDFSSGRRLP